MNRLPIGTRLQGLALILAAAGAFAILLSVLPAGGPGGGIALAADDMDAPAKALAKLDDDWSAAATRDAEKVASFYAESALAYPPNEPLCIGRAAAK